MATRPNKTAGNTSYTAEVAAGATTIKASEIDGDLNEIYANITNANIAAAAAIAYTKLALALSIQNSDLVALTITAAKIANLTIPVGKLAVNASTNAFATGAVTANMSAFTAESTIATAGPITTRGGRVLLSTALGLYVNVIGSPGTFRINVYRDAGVVKTVDWLVDGGVNTYPVPSPCFVDAVAAGAHTYTWKAMRVSGAGTLQTSANPGEVYILELA